jgi:hypothetical protein
MTDLTTFLDQLLYGGSEEDSEGGISKAAGLTEDRLVYEWDNGERPMGLFMTFDVPLAEGDVAYGPPHDPPMHQIDDPDDEDAVLLLHENARPFELTLYAYGVVGEHKPGDLHALLKAAQRYLLSQAKMDLFLAGISGRLVSPGQIRNATTVVNESVELRLAMTARFELDDHWSVSVGTFGKATLELESDGETDSTEEIEL